MRAATRVVTAGWPRPAPDCEGARDQVQPPADRPVPVEVGGLAGEDDEGGLEGVLGVGRGPQRPPAVAPDGRPVAADQGGERSLIAVGGVLAEQFAVRPAVGSIRRDQGLEAAEDCHGVGGHRRASSCFGLQDY